MQVTFLLRFAFVIFKVFDKKNEVSKKLLLCQYQILMFSQHCNALDIEDTLKAIEEHGQRF